MVTLVCVGFGYWVHWSKEWIRERHEWRAAHPHSSCGDMLELPVPTAPCGLWLFGETGDAMMSLGPQATPATVDEVRKLFPEAEVTTYFIIPKGGTIF